MKKIFLTTCAAIFLLAPVLHAATVSSTQAQSIAINFFKITYPAQVNHNAITATLKYTQTESDGSADFYVFDVQPAVGFVIVSAHDEAIPVLAYSNESYFNTDFQKTSVASWINKTAGQIHQTVLHQVPADARINNLWSAYRLGISPGSEKSSGVGPMLSTTWNQEPYYNQFCPINHADGQYSVTGCVATAMAQILKYWNYPAQGTGSFSYVDDNAHGYQINAGTLSANFGATTYPWTQMPNYITGNNTAVGTLMSHCGISVAMDYSDAGSGAYVIQSEANSAYGYNGAPCAEHSYITYFKYNPNTIQGVFQSNYTTTQWINLLEAEFNAGRVVQYEGFDPGAGGHTWVSDGYDVNNKLHMNWGWGGIDNGFYAVTNLNAGGYAFNYDDAALIGIEPLGFTPPGNSTCVTVKSTPTNNPCAYISSYSPAVNNQNTELVAQQWTFGGTPGETRALLSFNLSAIPANAYIVAANISLYADTIAGNGPSGQPTSGTNNACNLQQITSAWTANSVTWNNQPSITATNQVLLPQSTSNAENYLNYDITPFVKSWIQTPSQNYGMMLKMITSNYYNIMDFCSSQFPDTNKRPQLQICYLPCNAAASFTYQSLGGSVLQFTNTSTSNQGFSSSWTFYNAAGAFTTSTAVNPQITFSGQPPYSAQLIIRDSLGTSCIDTATLSISFNPNTTCIHLQNGPSHGTGAELGSAVPGGNNNFANGYTEFFSEQWTGNGNPIEARGLLRYDLSQIPAGSVIVSANLSLYTDTIGGNGYTGQPTYGTANASYIKQVTSAWTPATVNWTNQPTATTTNEVLLAQSTNDNENYPNLNISPFVQAWVNNPASNYGVLLQMIGQAHYNSMIFCSTGHPDTTKWPRLDICYIAPHSCQAHASFVQQNLGSGQVLFTNTSTDNIGFTYNWTFNNSTGPFTTSTANNPTITFTGQPVYSATLIISDSICSDTITQIVNLNNCLVLQGGGTRPTGAEITSIAPSLNSNFSTGYSEFFAEHWTGNGTPLEARGLLKYDLSQIPIGSVILSASLSLYTDTIGGNGYTGQPTYGTNNACHLMNITSGWNPATVDWANQPSTTTNNEVLLAQSTNVNENYLNLDVSAFVQNWVNNPNSNYGTEIEMIGQSYYNSMIFCSPGHPDTTKWPKLEICYLLASPCHIASAFTQINVGNASIQFVNTSTNNTHISDQWTFYNGNGQFSTSTLQNPIVQFSGPTPYSATLIITDTSTGCTDSLHQVVVVNSQPCAVSDSFSYQSLGGGNVQFTNQSTPTAGLASFWTFINAYGPFGTSILTNPQVLYTGPQPYSAELVVSDSGNLGCVDTFSRAVKLSVGINNIDGNQSEIFIYPNPNNGSFIINLPGDYNTETTEIKILDVLGREIEMPAIERYSGQFKLSIPNTCPAGIYTIVVSCNARQQCGKIVVVK